MNRMYQAAAAPPSPYGAGAGAGVGAASATSNMAVRSPAQLQGDHNNCLQYVHQCQKLTGIDPIETEGMPTCFSRPRQEYCGCPFNANSNKGVKAVSYLLHGLGAGGVTAGVLFQLFWLLNGVSIGGITPIRFSFLDPATDSLTYYWSFFTLFGYALMIVAHVLYLLGGSLVPVLFLLVLDAIGMSGSFVIMLAANTPTNRLLGLAFTVTPLPLLHLVAFVILLGRDPNYEMAPPQGTTLVGMPLDEAARLPRLAGVPLVPTPAASPYAYGASATEMYPQANMFGTAGKGRKKKTTGKHGKSHRVGGAVSDSESARDS